MSVRYELVTFQNAQELFNNSQHKSNVLNKKKDFMPITVLEKN